MTEVSSPLHRTKLFRYAKWALLALVLAYFAQFVRGALYKGQSRIGEAFETIGYEAFRKQYDGLPEMRVVYANASPVLCSFWSFEQIWGHCVSVSLEVRDYRPGHQPIVETQAQRLAEQIRKPCALLPTLKLSNEQELARDLECDGDKKFFKLRIWVNSVTVISDRGPASNPHRWQIANRQKLNEYYFQGEF